MYEIPNLMAGYRASFMAKEYLKKRHDILEKIYD